MLWNDGCRHVQHSALCLSSVVCIHMNAMNTNACSEVMIEEAEITRVYLSEQRLQAEFWRASRTKLSESDARIKRTKVGLTGLNGR